MGQYNWIVIRQEDFSAKCERCGEAEAPPYMPISVDVFVEWSHRFVNRHKDCKNYPILAPRYWDAM